MSRDSPHPVVIPMNPPYIHNDWLHHIPIYTQLIENAISPSPVMVKSILCWMRESTEEGFLNLTQAFHEGTVMAMAISYNRFFLFLWDYYKWGFVSAYNL